MAQSLPVLYLIDDDHIYHSITEMLMERVSNPHILRTFLNGREAIDEIMSAESPNLPDHILLDINMPVMNGWDFLDELEPLYEKMGKKPKVTMLSSSSLEQDVNRALDYENVKQFITKPVTIEHLESITSGQE